MNYGSIEIKMAPLAEERRKIHHLGLRAFLSQGFSLCPPGVLSVSYCPAHMLLMFPYSSFLATIGLICTVLVSVDTERVSLPSPSCHTVQHVSSGLVC